MRRLEKHVVARVEEVVPGKLFFAGKGHATHFGKYSIEGSNEFDDQGHVLNGEFTTTVSDGSTISGIYSGSYEVQEDGTIIFLVEVQWLTGTGRLEGVTGKANVIAILSGVEQGDTFEYFTQGTLTLPKRP